MSADSATESGRRRRQSRQPLDDGSEPAPGEGLASGTSADLQAGQLAQVNLPSHRKTLSSVRIRVGNVLGDCQLAQADGFDELDLGGLAVKFDRQDPALLDADRALCG